MGSCFLLPQNITPPPPRFPFCTQKRAGFPDSSVHRIPPASPSQKEPHPLPFSAFSIDFFLVFFVARGVPPNQRKRKFFLEGRAGATHGRPRAKKKKKRLQVLAGGGGLTSQVQASREKKKKKTLPLASRDLGPP